uniref:Immunoglobulin V-set domain-containing protein n=1 Tax=Myripristis murdjan TaxID=586833 RepID=A0A667ZMR3_9TELE
WDVVCVMEMLQNSLMTLNVHFKSSPLAGCTASSDVKLTLNFFRISEFGEVRGKEEYVFFYQDEHIDPDYQPPSFKNRVELKDKEMKNGDLSMILKNVKKEDSGTYECRFINDYLKIVDGVIIEDPPISTIRLEVPFPLTTICLLINLTLSLSLSLILFFVFFVFFVCFRRFRWRHNDSRLCE